MLIVQEQCQFFVSFFFARKIFCSLKEKRPLLDNKRRHISSYILRRDAYTQGASIQMNVAACYNVFGLPFARSEDLD